jgi:acyl-coenzyme A thioesterase PaaI-like protein
MEKELQQVLKGLALNRTPGWNFPGNFLQVSFDAVDGGSATLSVDPGPHCVDAGGNLGLGPLCVLLDIGMGGVMRGQVGPEARMATVSMSLQLTGAPAAGRMQATGTFDGYARGASSQLGLMRVELTAGDGTLVATGSGTFVALGNREGTAPLPMRKRGIDAEVPPLAPAELSEQEREVYERASRAMQGGPAAFIDRFWGLVPQRVEGGATLEFANGLHVGNRVGHTQGGITFAIAGVTAVAALGDEWKLVGISAWYVSPGTGPTLRATASVVHSGRLTAVVRVTVVDIEGKVVLEAMTNHARGA